MILVEQTDYEGNDCFWYLDEYDMYSILDCRIMDRVIEKKWKGKFDLNAEILDFSTAYTMFNDPFELFANDRVFQEMKLEMFTLDRSERTHPYQFHIWQHSMELRYQIEALFVAAFTVFFQLYLNFFNS